MNEKQLVKSAKSGDKNAFCQLYMAYNDRLYRYAMYKLGDTYDAQDAVSDCIVEAYESIHKLKDNGAFSAWIFKIMYRICCRHIADQMQKRNQDRLESINSSYTISDEAYELKEALSKLSDEEKDIVLLAIIGGYTSKEISAITGLKPATIRSKQSRALEKMKSFLE